MDEPPPVPDLLHSEFEEGPFTRCIACEADLSVPDRFYQIQKTWKGGQVVFELALCAGCAMSMLEQFSKESLEKMRRFFEERFRETAGLEECHFCGRERTPEAEFEVGAFCQGAFLARPIIVVCGDCTAASQENLSKKTRDAWGDFFDRHVPGVPMEMEPDRIPLTF